MSLSAAKADATLAALNTSFVRLHVGSPGAAGTGNPALEPGDTNAVLKASSFAAVENHPTNIERRRLSDAEVAWSGAELKSAQELTHFSIWDGSDPGTANVLHIAALTTAKTTGSDGASFASGDLEAAITVFAKP